MSTYKFSVCHEWNEQIITLLEKTIWGRKGPLFSHKTVKERIQSYPKNYYFCIHQENELVATVVFCERMASLTTAQSSEEIKTVYTRYFSVDPKHQGQGLGEKLIDYAEEYFTSEGFLEPVVFYAYQDKKNASSMRVADKKNVQIAAEFRTITFSRIAPKNKLKLKVSSNSNIKLTGKNTFHSTPSKTSKYYTQTDANGETLISARVTPGSWKIIKIPGFQGFLLKNIVSKLPLLNRIFNAKTFQFCAIDEVFIKDNKQNFEGFLESVLAAENENIALLWSDTNDRDYYQTITNFNNPGILEKLNSNVPACIRVHHEKLNESQINSLESTPFYISALDLT